MKRLFALKTEKIKSDFIRQEATDIREMEKFFEQKIKLCKTIQSKYKKLIECEQKRQKLEEELNEAITNYNIKEPVSNPQSSDDFFAAIKNIASQA